MSKETVKQYIRNQYTGKEQCQFLPQINQQDSLAHSSLKTVKYLFSDDVVFWYISSRVLNFGGKNETRTDKKR